MPRGGVPASSARAPRPARRRSAGERGEAPAGDDQEAAERRRWEVPLQDDDREPDRGGEAGSRRAPPARAGAAAAASISATPIEAAAVAWPLGKASDRAGGVGVGLVARMGEHHLQHLGVRLAPVTTQPRRPAPRGGGPSSAPAGRSRPASPAAAADRPAARSRWPARGGRDSCSTLRWTSSEASSRSTGAEPVGDHNQPDQREGAGEAGCERRFDSVGHRETVATAP